MKELKNYIILFIIFFINILIYAQNIEKNKDGSADRYIISKFEFSQMLPLSYFSGESKPSFSYGFNFTYTLPFKTDVKILKQNKFSAAIINQTSFTFNKIETKIFLTTSAFLDLHASVTGIFTWTISGNSGVFKSKDSFKDEEGKTTDAAGFNINLGADLKFGFSNFLPKVKLVFINKSLFSYLNFPGFEFWQINQYKITLKNGWIYQNDFIISWNEKIFSPYTFLSLSCFFENNNSISLSAGAGCQMMFEKIGLFINANASVIILSDGLSNKIRLILIVKHTFGKINLYKKD